jgi:hypothetical protein
LYLHNQFLTKIIEILFASEDNYDYLKIWFKTSSFQLFLFCKTIFWISTDDSSLILQHSEYETEVHSIIERISWSYLEWVLAQVASKNAHFVEEIKTWTWSLLVRNAVEVDQNAMFAISQEQTEVRVSAVNVKARVIKSIVATSVGIRSKIIL